MDGILDWPSPNWKVCKPVHTMVLSKHQGGNMVKTMQIFLGTTGEFLGDVEMTELGAWLVTNHLKAGHSTGTSVTVWPFGGDY